MIDSELLYLKLPVFLHHVACSIEGWRVRHIRFGKSFQGLFLEAEKRAFWTDEQIQSYRDARLNAFVHHCYHSVPFYRRRFKELRLSPEDIRTLDDLKRLRSVKRIFFIRTAWREFWGNGSRLSVCLYIWLSQDKSSDLVIFAFTRRGFWVRHIVSILCRDDAGGMVQGNSLRDQKDRSNRCVWCSTVNWG